MLRYSLHFVLMSLLMLSLGACGGGKQSAVEGKLVDWNGKPVSEVKITASQVEPLKGYERFETVTNLDGTFRVSGLFPSSEYVLQPSSEKWTCNIVTSVKSAPQGETSVLPSPIVINKAYSRVNGSSVVDLVTGATRFSVSSEGVISDSETGLEWFLGPDQDINYTQAEVWLSGCNAAGGGWRRPSIMELAKLYQPGTGGPNIDPVFGTNLYAVWGGPHNWRRGESSVFIFRNSFGSRSGKEYSYSQRYGVGMRVFAVRSRR